MGEGVTTTYYDLALHVVRPVTNYDLRLVVTKEYPVDTSYDISLEIAKAIKQGQDYDLALTISKVVALLQEYDLSLGVNKEVVLTTDYDLRCRVEKIISIQKDYDNALEVLKGKEYDLSLLVSKALAQTTDYDLALGVRKLGFFRWDADLEEWLEIDLGYVKLNQGDPQTIVNGNLSVNDPIDLYHVANKKYVDDKPSTFLGLTDTPSSYVGQAGKNVSVKGDASGLEFTTPASGVFTINEAEIDVGATPVEQATGTIGVIGLLNTSKIIGGVAYVAPTGKDADELEMDALEIKFEPRPDNLIVHIKGLEGYIADRFKIWYSYVI